MGAVIIHMEIFLYWLHCLPLLFQVKISVPLENLEYWVQAVDMEEKLLEVMGALLEITDSSPAGELRIGAICAALYDNLWYALSLTF